MLFNSYVFLFLFLPAVLALWWTLPRGGAMRLGLLVAASYAFYGWWDWRFTALLALSTLIDYYAGARLSDATDLRRRRGWLVVSMLTNLGLLAVFKYSGFAVESWNAIGHWLHSGGRIPVPEIVLPVGISFYTFQTMSYTIDIYRRQAQPASSLLHFAAYVSMFPQLIAGPIVRYTDVEDQLRALDRPPQWPEFGRGIWFFVAGMAQKILCADTIAAMINPLLEQHATIGFVAAWFAMLGYSCQLYFDFAGYSNMAIGLGAMLGFAFPKNFDSPYKSRSIAEFWRRWHITLSGWLRDYLFIPLGGSRHGGWLTLRNLIIVMFLGGLWHGAGWTFVLWGLYHGGLLAVHSLWRGAVGVKVPSVCSITITFLCVVFGWVLFRSTDMVMATNLLSAMTLAHGIESSALAAIGGVKSAAVLLGLLAIVFLAPNVWQMRIRPSLPLAMATAAVLVVCVLRFDAESPFLYFQF